MRDTLWVERGWPHPPRTGHEYRVLRAGGPPPRTRPAPNAEGVRPCPACGSFRHGIRQGDGPRGLVRYCLDCEAARSRARWRRRFKGIDEPPVVVVRQKPGDPCRVCGKTLVSNGAGRKLGRCPERHAAGGVA